MGRPDAASGSRILPGWGYGFGPVERPSRRTSSPVRLEFASLIVPDAPCSVNRCRAVGCAPLFSTLNFTVDAGSGDSARPTCWSVDRKPCLAPIFAASLKFK